MTKVRNCFLSAKKDEEKGKKHKGILIVGRNDKEAEEYIQKAKKNLEICELYKEKRLDYKIPEEWFYTMCSKIKDFWHAKNCESNFLAYYCALAILAKFGVESRNQRCTALFLRYLKDKGLIEYDDEFIDRITVYSDKEEKSDVDERENARYGSSVESEDIMEKYRIMIDVCKRCISQCEEVIYSKGPFNIPEELTK